MEKKDNHSKHVNKTRGTDKFIQKTRAVSLVFLCLPQVPFWSRQKTCFIAKQVCLSRQNVCCDKHNFVAVKYFCRNILFIYFLSWKNYVFCCDKHVLCLSRQKKLLMPAPANNRAVLTRRKVKPTKRRTNQNVALRVSSTASSSDFLVSALVADSTSFFNPATSVGLPTSLQNLTSKQPLVHLSS